MPKFLEARLRSEYGDNPHAIYGTMNKIGAMKGSKETAKGREMERKHEEKMKNHNVSEVRIEVHRGGKNRAVTGHTVHIHQMPKPASKSGAFMEQTHESTPFGVNEHGKMLAHVGKALGGAESAEAEPEMPEAGEEEGGEEE